MNIKDYSRKVLRELKTEKELNALLSRLQISQEELNSVLGYLETLGYEFNMRIEGDRVLIKENQEKRSLPIKLPTKEELNVIHLAIVSDTHMGSNDEQLTLLEKFYDEVVARGITEVYHVGDITDGNYIAFRQSQLYSAYRKGTSDYLYHIVDHYPRRDGVVTKVIAGNHDATFMNNGGFDFLRTVADLRDDIINLGPDQAVVYLANGHIPMLLKHPDDGASKGLSYKPQELINSFEPSEKPKVALIGHYHKSYLAYYNGVYMMLVPCMVAQSGFMKRKNLKNVVGALFIDIYYDKKYNIQYFDYEEKRYTDQVIKDDYINVLRKENKGRKAK